MTSSNLLKLGNVRKVKENLSYLLTPAALKAIETEIEKNTMNLYDLGVQHYRFAHKLPARHWRQKVSRLYYAAYSASRAIRLYVDGHYMLDVKDHQKIGDLPDDFPNKARFANKLSVLRDDRNMCDYDHTSRAADLVTSPQEALHFVSEFLEEGRKYLAAKGLKIRGRI